MSREMRRTPCAQPRKGGLLGGAQLGTVSHISWLMPLFREARRTECHAATSQVIGIRPCCSRIWHPCAQQAAPQHVSGGAS